MWWPWLEWFTSYRGDKFIMVNTQTHGRMYIDRRRQWQYPKAKTDLMQKFQVCILSYLLKSGFTLVLLPGVTGGARGVIISFRKSALVRGCASRLSLGTSSNPDGGNGLEKASVSAPGSDKLWPHVNLSNIVIGINWLAPGEMCR